MTELKKFMGAERLILMEMNTMYTQINSYSTGGEITTEQAFDGEYTLPDFCPDIGKILNFTLTPYIQSTTQNGSKATIDGIVKVRVLYRSTENNEMRSYMLTSSFSKNIDLKDEDSFISNCKAECGYLNCRAINERKFDIHGSINIHISPMNKSVVSAVCKLDSDDLQSKCRSVDFCNLIGDAEKLIVINDEITLDETNGSILNIIHENAWLKNEEIKSITDKVVYKSDLELKFTYLNENGGYETLHRSFPVNQIIEVAGMTESADCIGDFSVCGLELKPYTDKNGDCLSVVMNVKIRASIKAWEHHCENVVIDAYSTKYELDTENQKSSVYNVYPAVCFSETMQQTFDISDGAKEIISINYDKPIFKTTASDDGARVCGSVKANMLYINEQAECCSTQMELELDTVKPISNNFNSVKTVATIDSQTFTLNSTNSIELRCECNFELQPSSSTNEVFITSISRDENKIKQSDCNCAMILYFAKKGESIWDIARKFNSCTDDIMQQNDIKNDVLDIPKMLIIPSMA